MLGSDKISTIEEPVVDVTLDLQRGQASISGSKSDQVSLEFNSDNLGEFIKNLETINKVCINLCYIV